MQKIRVTRGMATGAALAVAITGGASAAALATSRSPSKSFQACLSSKQRTLYNVHFNPATPPVCRRRDKRVSWNQTGPTGPSGQTGPAGLPGQAGQPGQPGQAGQPGADGKTILNGSGAPAATLGTVGDFFIDTAAHAIYGPKTASGWGSAVSLVGPKGDQGSPGVSGFTTVTGATGTVPAGNEGAIDVPCPSGQTAISGGYTIPFTATVLEDHPASGNPGSWHVAAAFPSTSGTITAYVQCATVQ